MLTFHTFLGCISLRTGSYIIGIISTLGAILRVIGYSVIAGEISRMTPEIIEQEAYLYSVQGTLIAIILVDVAAFFFSLCLAYGVKMNISGCIKAWTRSHKLVIPIDFGCYMILALIYFIAGVPGLGFAILIFGWAHALITTYFYLVVRSHQRDTGFIIMP